MTGLSPSGESWTDMVFPETGAYVVPDDVGLVDIDRAKDIGTYVEAGVWVQYPEAAGHLVGPAASSTVRPRGRDSRAGCRQHAFHR
jgi:hypothetical protein